MNVFIVLKSYGGDEYIEAVFLTRELADDYLSRLRVREEHLESAHCEEWGVHDAPLVLPSERPRVAVAVIDGGKTQYASTADEANAIMQRAYGRILIRETPTVAPPPLPDTARSSE